MQTPQKEMYISSEGILRNKHIPVKYRTFFVMALKRFINKTNMQIDSGYQPSDCMTNILI